MHKNSASRHCCFYETLEKRLPATTNTTLNVVPYPFALNTLSDRTLPPLPLSLKYNLAMNILTTNATDTFLSPPPPEKNKRTRILQHRFSLWYLSRSRNIGPSLLLPSPPFIFIPLPLLIKRIIRSTGFFFLLNEIRLIWVFYYFFPIWCYESILTFITCYGDFQVLAINLYLNKLLSYNL